MTKLLAACLTFIAFTIIGSSASAADFAAADLKMDAIKQTLELQLERIRNAREKADTQMSLARMRIAERLRLSSEEMARQLEVLQRLREQLSEGTGDSQQAIDQLRSNWAGLLDTAFAEINSQVSPTNDLISQMEALRNNFQDPQASNPTLSVSPSPQTFGASQTFSPSGPLPTTDLSPTVPPAPTSTAPTIVSTAPTAPATGST